ncbi:helicase [Actinomadura sp. CNU-125]|uniref:helicase-related protein n=1 Tax=Actinomadura sp. CNU-125 TaxID=1904961 RepID=UPI00095C36AF|nr:helicase-related protein [Actinomadura sp. CNU-125]OLT28358.1 helicase [Actinomadura sp. CNU-125]
MSVNVPEAAEFVPGVLVRARGREWVVQPGSDADLLILRPLGGAQDDLVGVLPALEDVELASFPPPTPDDLGDQTSAGLLRSALRIGFRSGAGPFRSLAQLAVDPRSYQFVPLLMALRQETVRLLIADDVGIGKTVESGLIAAEMLAQGEASGLAVLCSPALAEQWQEELRGKFGIEAELVLSSTVPRLERSLDIGESLFQRHPNVIVSTDYIKNPRHRDEFLRHCPDLVIVDEAHTCVTAGSTGSRDGRQLRHELVGKIAADRSRHLLLVTATPHSGKDEAFRDLLALLDPELADVPLDTDAGRKKLARHFVQRRRADVRSFIGEETPFPKDRESKELTYKLSAEYRKLFEAVLDYAREQALDETDGVVRQRVRWWSALALLRSLASSPRAAAQTLRTRAANLDAKTVPEADELGRIAVMDLTDDDSAQAVDAAPGADLEDADGAAPQQRLRRLAKQAEALEGNADSKLTELTKLVKNLLKDGYNPIVFCRFIPTAEYVAEHLGDALGKKTEVASVTGTLSPAQRIARIDRMISGAPADEDAEEQTRPERRVLVATDCLSEGVNLQEGFDAVVHYDLAWNPTRHEQREGRVDRYGQRRDTVRAVTIYGSDNQIDGIVWDILIRKHAEIRKATGVSVAVLDESDSVMNAVLEGLLLRREDAEQLSFDFGFASKRDDLHAEWVSAAEREKASRARFAQHAIHADEVAREVTEIRAALGSGAEVAEFVRTAVVRLRGQLADNPDGTLTADTGGLPNSLLSGLEAVLGPKNARQITFHPLPPVKRGEAALVRTDATVGTLARFVLDAALDPKLDGWQRPARRCGVVRTTSVPTRTTLLLVRHRFHLQLPTRDGGRRRQIAEDARVLAFRGSPAKAEWLSEEEALALLDVRADENTPEEFATATATRVLDGLDTLRPHLDQYGRDLADNLRASHARVREAAGAVRRGLRVEADRSADVLGLYVYLPVTGEAAR